MTTRKKPEQDSEGIQKYTKYINLINRAPHSKAEIAELTAYERPLFDATLAAMLDKLKGPEQDDLIERVSELKDDQAGNITYQQNQARIEEAIVSLAGEGNIISISSIAQRAEVTRRTVYRHLDTLKNSNWWKTQGGIHRVGLAMLGEALLGRALEYAYQETTEGREWLQDYLKIAKLLLPAESNTTVNNINILAQVLAVLSPEQLERVKPILQGEAREI